MMLIEVGIMHLDDGIDGNVITSVICTHDDDEEEEKEENDEEDDLTMVMRRRRRRRRGRRRRRMTTVDNGGLQVSAVASLKVTLSANSDLSNFYLATTKAKHCLNQNMTS